MTDDRYLEAAHTIIYYTNPQARVVHDAAERRRRFLPEARALANEEWVQVVVNCAARAEQERIVALWAWRQANDLRGSIGMELERPLPGEEPPRFVMDTALAVAPQAGCACTHDLDDHGSKDNRVGCRASGCACYYPKTSTT